MKRVLTSLILLSLVLVTLASSSFVKASEKDEIDDRINQTLDQFFDQYYQSFVSGQPSDFGSILASTDETYLFEKFFKWKVQSANLLDTTYRTYHYTYEITEKTIKNNDIFVTVLKDAKYYYNNNDVECGESNIKYDIQLSDKNGNLMITKITTDDDDFIIFKKRIGANEQTFSNSENNNLQLEQNINKVMQETIQLSEEINDLDLDDNVHPKEKNSFFYNAYVNFINFVLPHI